MDTYYGTCAALVPLLLLTVAGFIRELDWTGVSERRKAALLAGLIFPSIGGLAGSLTGLRAAAFSYEMPRFLEQTMYWSVSLLAVVTVAVVFIQVAGHMDRRSDRG